MAAISYKAGSPASLSAHKQPAADVRRAGFLRGQNRITE